MLQLHGIGDGVWPPASRRPRLERALKELRSARAHHILIALGHLRDRDEFSELSGLFRASCPDRAGGDIVALVQSELGSDRAALARCAQMLRAIGVGDGSWPPRLIASLEHFLDCSTPPPASDRDAAAAGERTPPSDEKAERGGVRRRLMSSFASPAACAPRQAT